MSRGVKVVAKKGEELPALDILANEIQIISKLGRNIMDSRLSRKAILVLLSHHTGLAQQTIRTVLEALPQLEKEYLK